MDKRPSLLEQVTKMDQRLRDGTANTGIPNQFDRTDPKMAAEELRSRSAKPVYPAGYQPPQRA